MGREGHRCLLPLPLAMCQLQVTPQPWLCGLPASQDSRPGQCHLGLLQAGCREADVAPDVTSPQAGGEAQCHALRRSLPEHDLSAQPSVPAQVPSRTPQLPASKMGAVAHPPVCWHMVPVWDSRRDPPTAWLLARGLSRAQQAPDSTLLLQSGAAGPDLRQAVAAWLPGSLSLSTPCSELLTSRGGPGEGAGTPGIW